jgi:hypothetical protein
MRKLLVAAVLSFVAVVWVAQYARGAASTARTSNTEAWENLRKVYQMTETPNIDSDLKRLGTRGYQVVAVQVVSTPGGVDFYEIYFKRRT